jgi:hypothetical protein
MHRQMATGSRAKAGTAPDGEGQRLKGVFDGLLRRPVAIFLILLMAVGSVFLWIGVPFLWIWGVSHAVKTSQPTLGPYVVVLAGMPVTMWFVGKLLYRLNHVYSRVTGQTYQVRVQLPWHRSLRDSSNASRPSTVLEVVMIGSVSVALLAFGIWFFFFAGSSLPS